MKLHRQYVANVIYTVVGAPFQTWVSQVMEQRNQRITSEQQLDIRMDPEVYKAFQASTAVTQQKGTSGMIMKASSKRRRGKEQIRREKEKEEAKKQADEAKLNQFDAMQQQMNQMQHQLNDATVMHG